MDMRNCFRCGKLFQYTDRPICLDCVQLDEEDFQKVRLFLKENKGASIEEVSKETNVSIKRIHKYLKEGKLEVYAGSPLVLKCDSCGKTIQIGRFCKDCQTKFSDAITEIYKKEEKETPKESSGMHLSKYKNK